MPRPRVPCPDENSVSWDHRLTRHRRDLDIGRIRPVPEFRLEEPTLHLVVAYPERPSRQSAFRTLAVREQMRLVRAQIDCGATRLVGPGAVELRPAQRFGVRRRHQRRLGAVGPHKHVPARPKVRAAIRRGDGKKPRFPLHHHRPDLIDGLADQRDPPRPARRQRRRPLHLGPDPFCPSAGLSRTATA